MTILEQHFPNLSSTQREQFAQLYPLYSEWNEKINVISRKDIEHLYDHHILHSMAMAKVISFAAGTRVVDIGTGGGLPGIPLAILFPETEFWLVDSIGKKVKVAEAIAQAVGLKNVKTLHARAESLPTKHFDFALARAVTALPDLWKWSVGLLKKEQQHDLANGLLTFKGNDETLQKEREALPPNVYSRVFPLSDFYPDDFYATKCIVWVGRRG